MWYKNAVIYNLDVETFMDSNGDGIGDFPGLTQRIDHLENLGVDCVWLQPFHPTPNLDDGYDITDYYAVDSRLGSLGDFADFSFELRQRGIRLIIDLVVNHTSDQHPWFQQGCDPKSPFHDFYIWSAERPADHDKGTVFPGVQKTTWTWNRKAGAYYFHRFYEHQPDLNIANPAVRREILKIMGFWLELGVSGFRVDAAPFLIELTNGKGGQGEQGEAMYAFLREMHDFIGWRCGDAIMLAEANVSRDKIDEYFGDGDRMHMLFAFLLNQPLFLSLARKRPEALARALEGLPRIPEKGQWAQFLRGHDEIDLGRLTPEERRGVLRRLRAREEHAALRPRRPPPPGTHAGQRPAPDRDGAQPDVQPARQPGDALRRRDRHGRRPLPGRADGRAHAHAVVGRSQCRLLHGTRGEAHPARDQRARLRSR